MSRKNSFFRQKTAVILLFLIGAYPLFALAQSGQADRDRNIQKTMDSMEAELQVISDASQNTLKDVQATESAPLINTGTSRKTPSQIPVKENILQKQTSKEPGASSAPSYFGQSLREQKMEITLRNIAIEISLEYFVNMGEQSFVAIYSDTGDKMSRLKFPLKGGIPVVKGEVRFLPRISLGGKYADSLLKKRTSSDEDWNLWEDIAGVPTYVDYQITHQASRSRVEFYDINLYYNLFNFSNNEEDRRKLFPVTGPVPVDCGLDGISLDVFGGYQYYKSRNQLIDPMYNWDLIIGGTWYEDASLPADISLDSFYKIEYKGPRIGFRTTGSKGKLTSGLRFALALLETDASGWWNLRQYSFQHRGSNGYGVDFGLETTYAFTPSFSLGLGFDYLGYYQKKMKASGVQPGYSYEDQDIIRNANSYNYGPTLMLKYIW